MKEHIYKSTLNWTGNTGRGTEGYSSYERSYTIKIKGKAVLDGSSDPAFRGDATKHNPEELFLVSISSCHMLWYLHLCSVNKIVVLEYEDEATGTMEEDNDGSGRFTEVVLHPAVKVSDQSMIEKASSLHKQANEKCFIANSCNFKIKHNPKCFV